MQIHAIQGDLFVNTTRAASGVLPLLLSSRLALPHDVIVLNFGLWHGEVQRPRYIQHLHELGEFYAANKDKLPNIMFMVGREGGGVRWDKGGTRGGAGEGCGGVG